MGKKIKKYKKESSTQNMINNNNKKIKRKCKDNINVEEKKINIYKKKKRNSKKMDRKNSLLYIISMKKRINEMLNNYKIKKLLLQLYNEKINKLTEEYNEMTLMKYNCLNNNRYIR